LKKIFIVSKVKYAIKFSANSEYFYVLLYTGIAGMLTSSSAVHMQLLPTIVKL